jgi:alanine racemase
MRDVAEDRPVWAWIDEEALRHNARRAIECAEGRAVIGVVKADGYGHGAAEIASGLLAAGVSRLAVVSVAEGAALRRAGIGAPILLMGGLDDRESAQRAIKWALTPVLHDERSVELALGLGRGSAPLGVEIEIDTGMRRMGIPAATAAASIRRVASAAQLTLGGLYTHLARADERDPQPSRDQILRLREVLADAGDALGTPMIHVVNSAGLLRRKAIEDEVEGLRTGGVRPGLMLYGVSPFPDESAEDLDLRPVMTLAARVVAIRDVGRGEGVGYGGEWRAQKRTRVATLPLGYADGIPRSVLGRGEVVLAGVRHPIVGRVSMDYIGVEIGDAAVEVGTVATIFGSTPEGLRVPVETLAAAAGTIGYEMLTNVGARVPRRVGAGPPPASDPRPLDPAV